MMMEISSIYLKAFYQLAQDRNFTKAASNLALTQSAFSHRILNLERDLETTLVIREKGNIQLTEAGDKLLRYYERAHKMESEALSSIYNKESKDLVGSVRFGGFSSVNRSMLLPALAPLMRENPRLNLSLSSVELDELSDLMRTSKVDFVLSNKEPQNQQIQADFLGFEENVLVESTKYDFNGVYLDHDANDVTTSSYFKLKPELKGDRKRYLGDVYGLIDGVKLGMGRAILPSHLIENEKDLKILFPRTKLKVKVYLLYYKNSYYTKIEQEVISAVHKYFKDRF